MGAVDALAGDVTASARTPGPDGVFAIDASLDPLEIIGHLFRKYGDVVRYQSRFGPCLLFVRPEHIQAVVQRKNIQRASLVKMILGNGLLASDGEYWKSQRQLMQRHFLPRRIQAFAPIMASETVRTEECWEIAARNGAPVDIVADMSVLALRVLLRTLFTSELSVQEEISMCSAVTRAVTELGRISWTIFGVPTALTPRGNNDLETARGVLDAYCHDQIARRRALPPGQRPPDLLTLLLEATTERGPLEDRELRDEMVTMLIAGHETTALALSWTWKALAEHPEIEARLHREVDVIPSGSGADPEALTACPWTRAVFQESMRLYPPVWSVARTATADEIIDGHAVPKGACVLIATWFTHRHRDYWQDAETFDPARFLENAAHPSNTAYAPFGGGRHTCVGMHFALFEGTLILAKLAQRFRVRPLPGQDIRANPGITLRQSPSLRAYIEIRGHHGDTDRRVTTAMGTALISQ